MAKKAKQVSFLRIVESGVRVDQVMQSDPEVKRVGTGIGMSVEIAVNASRDLEKLREEALDALRNRNRVSNDGDGGGAGG